MKVHFHTLHFVPCTWFKMFSPIAATCCVEIHGWIIDGKQPINSWRKLRRASNFIKSQFSQTCNQPPGLNEVGQFRKSRTIFFLRHFFCPIQHFQLAWQENVWIGRRWWWCCHPVNMTGGGAEQISQEQGALTSGSILVHSQATTFSLARCTLDRKVQVAYFFQLSQYKEPPYQQANPCDGNSKSSILSFDRRPGFHQTFQAATSSTGSGRVCSASSAATSLWWVSWRILFSWHGLGICLHFKSSWRLICSG